MEPETSDIQSSNLPAPNTEPESAEIQASTSLLTSKVEPEAGDIQLHHSTLADGAGAEKPTMSRVTFFSNPEDRSAAIQSARNRLTVRVARRNEIL
jgi:hypothetical protein